MIIKMDYYKKYLKYKILFTKNPTNQKYHKKYKYYKYKLKYINFNYKIKNIELTEDIQYILLKIEEHNRRILQTFYNQIPDIDKYMTYNSFISRIKSEKFLINLDKLLVNLFETKNKFISGVAIDIKDVNKIILSSIDFATYFVSSFLSRILPTSLITDETSKYSAELLSFINLNGELYLSDIIENNDMIIKKYTNEKRQLTDKKEYKYRETILLSIKDLIDYLKKIMLKSLIDHTNVILPENFEENIINKLNNFILSIGLTPKFEAKIINLIKIYIHPIINDINEKNAEEKKRNEKMRELDLLKKKQLEKKKKEKKEKKEKIYNLIKENYNKKSDKERLEEIHQELINKRSKNNMFDF